MATLPSLEASQQSHINDLVQRNRSLEHAAKLIRDDLDREKTRAKHVLSDVHKRWKADQKEWHEGVDVLLSCHRIVLWRETIHLQTERLNFLREEEDIRVGKIARLQRDYRIAQFQQGETQYASRQELLEAEVDILNRKQIIQKDKWKAHSAELLSRVQERETRLEAATTELDRLSEELTAQREETARQKNMYQSTTPQLDRLRLQIEGAEAKHAELHRENDDLRRAKQELDRQLSKWQNLETKGGADMEKERKRRIELEAEVQALQNRLEKIREKEKHKVEKLKESLTEWQTHAELEKEACEETKQRLEQAVKKNAKLKAALEKERAKVKTTKSDVTMDEEEESKVPASSPSPTPQPQPKSRAKPNPAPKAETTTEESGEVEEVLLGKKKGKTERSTKSRSKSQAEADVPEDSEIEEVPAPKPAVKGRSKRRAASPDSVVEVEAPKKKRAGSEVREVAPAAKRARSATVSRAGSVQPVQPKQLRRINIFAPPGNNPTFNFGVQEGASGLNIPTALSPVKESEVPPRASTFSSLSKYTGSIARRA